MPVTLANGYVFHHLQGTHYVNNTLPRSFIDHDDKTIVVSDNGGSRSELAEATAEAVDRSYVVAARRAAQQSRESAIEVLHGLAFRKVPVITDDAPRLRFSPPSDG